MAKIIYHDETLALEEGQTVLSALLNQGHDIPHSCQAGACQSCLMQAIEGEIPADAQLGLKPTQAQQGYFLACRCEPKTDLHIHLPDTAENRIQAQIVDLSIIGPGVLRVRLKAQADFHYHAGQYLTLWANGIGRSYSLASVPAYEDFLELHIRLIPGGMLSPWLFNHAKVGDWVEIQGPHGDCFYLEGDSQQPLILVGTSTGLAPLYGIARDALQQGHQGDIHLLHGALTADGLYLHNSLQQLAAQHTNLHYQACTLEPTHALSGVKCGDITELALQLVPQPKGWKVYLCGAADLVDRLKKQFFLAGANMQDIHSDPFVSPPGA